MESQRQQLSTAVQRAFLTWQAVPNTQTTSNLVGFTQASPTSGDGATVLGFENRPELDRTLAATSFFTDSTTGEIVESDIFFNSAFTWSTSDAGVSGRFDVESIALHEIGHLFGLSHSALGETELRAGGRRVLGAEAVMFPIAFSAGDISDRRLKSRRCCRLLGHLRQPDVPAPDRQRQRQGHEERQRRTRRSRRRVQSCVGKARWRVHVERRRGIRDRRAGTGPPGSPCGASGRW